MAIHTLTLCDDGTPPKIWLAKIHHEFRDGCHIFTSDEVPGFMIASRDANKVLRQLIPTVKALIKLNLGINCTVTVSQSLKDFNKRHFKPTTADTNLCLKDLTLTIQEAA